MTLIPSVNIAPYSLTPLLSLGCARPDTKHANIHMPAKGVPNLAAAAAHKQQIRNRSFTTVLLELLTSRGPALPEPQYSSYSKALLISLSHHPMLLALLKSRNGIQAAFPMGESREAPLGYVHNRDSSSSSCPAPFLRFLHQSACC